MSEFLRKDLRSLAPYVPGEQPKDGKPLIKLNTNESPFPPSEKVLKALSEAECAKLNLYSDPTELSLKQAIADFYSVKPENVVCSNGSDEVLAFAFYAFCNKESGVQFASVSYGFYPVFANLFGLPQKIHEVNDRFEIEIEPYISEKATAVIANPNAQTGHFLPLCEIERLVTSDPARVVIIDEAYVDFGAESAVSLTKKYKNLLVVQTFSKSRSLAGARVGFAVGSEALISDLERVRNSFNPYNVNRLSLLAATEAIKDKAYFTECTEAVKEARAQTASALRKMGFEILGEFANFLMARHSKIGGKELNLALREKGILVRHFTDPKISDFNRITIGSKAQMQELVDAVSDILTSRKETV